MRPVSTGTQIEETVEVVRASRVRKLRLLTLLLLANVPVRSEKPVNCYAKSWLSFKVIKSFMFWTTEAKLNLICIWSIGSTLVIFKLITSVDLNSPAVKN